MSKKNFILLIMLTVLLRTGMLLSAEGDYIGIIASVNPTGKEIVINIKGNKALDTGSKIYTRIGEDIVVMETTFVMMTTSRCKLVDGSEKYIRKLEKGMGVWRFDRRVLESAVLEEEQVPLPQNRDTVLSEESVTWLGIDYTLARFSFIDESAQKVKDNFPFINEAVVNNEDIYDIRKFFNKKTVTYDLSEINSNNQKIDIEQLKVGSSYTVKPNEIRRLISSYKIKGRNGLGLVFIAENMNKSSLSGSYYVCFIDLKTRNIIDSSRVEGKAGGAGFLKYWARSVLDGMKRWK